MVLCHKMEMLKTASPVNIDELQHQLKQIKAAENISASEKEAVLRLLNRDDDFVMLEGQSKSDKTISDQLYDNAGCLAIATGVLFAAVCMQVAQDLKVKVLLGLQLMLLLGALCLVRKV
jgi:hypothetical protein